MFNWLCVVKKVSDLTKLNWSEVFDMNICEFLNYATFCVEYQYMEEQQIKSWKLNH